VGFTSVPVNDGFGDKLGPYEILAPIGAGVMGEVYKGRDPRLDRVVAPPLCVIPTSASGNAGFPTHGIPGPTRTPDRSDCREF
jgi:hypothetical protein